MSYIDEMRGMVFGLEQAASICERISKAKQESRFAQAIRREARTLELKHPIIDMGNPKQGDLFQ